MRRELAAEREQSQQMMVEKESEIVSLRTTKERLEKNIHAHQIRYQIEREYMEDTMKVCGIGWVTVITAGFLLMGDETMFLGHCLIDL